jgi:hypothetical protein
MPYHLIRNTLRRRGIFVESASKIPKLRRSDIVQEYAAPTELGFFVYIFYRDFAPTVLRMGLLRRAEREWYQPQREPYTLTHFPDFADSSTASNTR